MNPSFSKSSDDRSQEIDESPSKLNAHESDPGPHILEARRALHDAAGVVKLIEVQLHKGKSAKVRQLLGADSAMSAVKLLEPFLHEVKKKNVFPGRPGKEKCMNYMKFGNCKFGPTCRFDHPPKPKTPAESLQDIVRSKGNTALTRAWWLCDTIGEILDKTDVDSWVGELGQIVLHALVRGFHEMTEITLQFLSDRGATATELHGVRNKTYGLETHFIKIMIPQLQRHDKWEDVFYVSIKDFHEFNYHTKKLSASLGLVLAEMDAKMNSSIMQQLALPTSTDNSRLIKLHQDILSYSFQQSFSMYEVAQARDQARMELQDILHEYFGMLCNEAISVTLGHFGSCANTVGTIRSDIDFLLKLTLPVSSVSADGELTENSEHQISHPILTSHTPFEILLMCMEALFCANDIPDDVHEEVDDALTTLEATPNYQEKLVASMMDLKQDHNSYRMDEQRLNRVMGKFALRAFVIKARVPVLKLVHVETAVEIDLVLAETNQMAILNTQLIRSYCKQDPRVRPLLFAVKRWSNARGVSDSTNSTLSSYAWVILVIFFLLKTKDSTDSNSIKESAGNEDSDGILTNLQGIDPFGDEIYREHSTQQSLTQIYEDVLASLPVDSNLKLLENEFPLKKDGDVASEDKDMKCAGDNCASLLLKFFAFYATECSGSLQIYDNIVSIRLAEQILKAEKRENRSSDSVHIDAYERAQRRGTAMLEKAEREAEVVTPAKVLDPLARLIKEKASNGNDGDNNDDSDGLTDKLDSLSLMDSFVNNDLSLTPSDNNSVSTPASSVVSNGSSVKISARPKNLPRRDSLDGTPSKSKQIPVLNATGSIAWRFGIEDPFELEHDLGGVIRSVIGHAHIMNEMRRALNVLAFHTLPDLCPPEPDENVFALLCEECTEVPHIPFTCRICGEEGHGTLKCPFNVCRKCGGQGHYIRDCPGKGEKKRDHKKRSNKNRNKKSNR